MRYALSILLTLTGLAAFHLFASGSLVSVDGTWSPETLWTRALSPFFLADPFPLLILSLGVGCFAAGVVMVPRTTMHVSSGPGSHASRSQIDRYYSQLSREKLLETALLINVLVVAAVTGFLAVVAVRNPAAATSTLGILLLMALVQVVIGLIISGVLFARKRAWQRRRRAPFFFSAGLNLLEAVVLTAVLFLGYL